MDFAYVVLLKIQDAKGSVTNTTPWSKRLYLWSHYGAFLRFLWSNYGANKRNKHKFMEHFEIVYVDCFYIQISINSSTIVLTSMFLGFQMRTFLLELNLNHCLLLLFVSCCMCSYYIFWKNMGFLKNYVANMGQIAKKLGKSSIYGGALKLCSLLVRLPKS